MIRIVYNLTGYEDFFKKLAKSFGLKINGRNEIHFTPQKGSGYCRLVVLPSNLPIIISDYISEESIFYHRKKTSDENFVLRLSSTGGGLSPATIYFGKTTQEWYHITPERTHVQNIDVIITKKWLYKYLIDEETKKVLINYFRLKTPLVIFEEMDADKKQLFSDIFKKLPDDDLAEFILQNRIALIIEKFLYNLYINIQSEYPSVNISSHEFKRVQLAAKELIEDFTQKPPSIVQLSAIAAMSPSKLQNLFKKIYGAPINHYYQKERLLKARSMLISKKYSVSETAKAVGFESVTAFKKAYAKIYEQFP